MRASLKAPNALLRYLPAAARRTDIDIVYKYARTVAHSQNKSNLHAIWILKYAFCDLVSLFRELV